MTRYDARRIINSRHTGNEMRLGPLSTAAMGVMDLTPLPDIGTRKVDINDYPELLNEPYSFSFEDNGQRPEFTVTRPRFLLKVEGDTCMIAVGSRIAFDGDIGRTQESSFTLSKASTNYSVLNVYDTYGLDVTYAFLDYIYHHKFYRTHSSWLILYLEGSFYHILEGAALPSINRDKSLVYYIISSILLQLVLLDGKKLKLGYELESMTLPSDLVARITGSERVSKEIGQTVRAIRCSELPTPSEVSGQTSHGGTYREADGHLYSALEIGDHLYTVYELAPLGDDIFQIDIYEGEGSIGSDNDTVAESLYNYYASFAKRHCDGTAGVGTLLSSLESELELTEVGAWTLQLLSDLGASGYEGTYTSQELRSLLSELIEECRLYDWSE